MICGSYYDNTWIIKDEGVGLYEHYGMWGFILTNPFIVYFTIKCWKETLSLLDRIYDITTCQAPNIEISKIKSRSIVVLTVCSKSKYVLYLLITCGFLALTTNILQTIDPENIYGNDVFDSYKYFYGFIFTKIFLCITWCLIYPLAIYMIVSSSVVVYIVMRTICALNLLRIDLFNRDRCGGLSVFGKINIYILTVYLLVYLVIYLLFETHSSIYFTVELSLTAISIFIVLQSIIGVYPVHQSILAKKNEIIDMLNIKLNIYIDNPESISNFPENLFTLRNYISTIHTYPYADKANTAVNFVRFIPTVLAIYKIIA